MSIYPQRETFIYYSETKDKYGTITSTSGTTYDAYIEREKTFSADGSVVSKGKIFTTSSLDFKLDMKVVIDGIDYFINTIDKYTFPGYEYKVLEYV